MPAVMNAANEWAVGKFLSGDLKFLKIYDIIEYCMEHVPYISDPTLGQILAVPGKVDECIEALKESPTERIKYL